MNQNTHDIPLTGIRVPAEVKEAIVANATANRRSMNAQVATILVSVLNGSLEQAAYERGLLAGLRQSDLLG